MFFFLRCSVLFLPPPPTLITGLYHLPLCRCWTLWSNSKRRHSCRWLDCKHNLDSVKHHPHPCCAIPEISGGKAGQRERYGALTLAHVLVYLYIRINPKCSSVCKCEDGCTFSAVAYATAMCHLRGLWLIHRGHEGGNQRAAPLAVVSGAELWPLTVAFFECEGGQRQQNTFHPASERSRCVAVWPFRTVISNLAEGFSSRTECTLKCMPAHVDLYHLTGRLLCKD